MKSVFYCPKCGRKMHLTVPTCGEHGYLHGEAQCECGNVIKGIYAHGDADWFGGVGKICDEFTKEVLLEGKTVPENEEDIDTIRQDLERMKLQRDEAKKHCEELAYERDEAQADLAQMKSTLSDTQQTLRAVQEDRDEFAAKMNDAVERAEQLQAQCGDLESILKERDSEKISLLQQICQLKAECGDMEKERDEAAEKIKDFENLKRRIEGMMEAFQLIVKGSGIGGD